MAARAETDLGMSCAWSKGDIRQIQHLSRGVTYLVTHGNVFECEPRSTFDGVLMAEFKSNCELKMSE